MKRKIIGFATLLIIFSILGTLLVYERLQNPKLATYEAQSQKIFDDAKNQFEQMRNVTLPPNIKLYVYTKQQAIERWGKNSSNGNTDSGLRQENVYKSLFLIEEKDTLDDATMEWVSSWTAVTVNNEIYVIYENFWPWDMPNAEATLIHELTHVWQSSLLSPISYDTNRAYNALLEGDADYMRDCYITQYSNNTNFKDYNHSNSLAAFPLIPRQNTIHPNVHSTVTELNLFAYINGKTFVSVLVNNGGWDRLNLCYTAEYTPCTTEQILHPDKYFTGETAKFTIVPAPVDDNWTIIPNRHGYASDTYGEYFIYVMLSRWLSGDQAQKAATGWGGDSFTYYEKDHEFLFVWNITWDSIQDASEFHQAFRDMLNIAQANPQGINTWFTNGRYLTLTWDPNTESTMILCSTNQTATDQLFFI
jgi:hypothetical protein